MTLTGELIDAQRAAAWGLVNRVVPATQLLETAIALADVIAANGPLAVRTTKDLVRRSVLDDPKRGWATPEELHAVFASEIRRHHRPVHRHQSRFVLQPGVQRRVVAVSDERLRILLEHLRVQQRQQLRRTPSPARADHRINALVRECAHQLCRPLLRQAGNRRRLCDLVGTGRVRPVPTKVDARCRQGG